MFSSGRRERLSSYSYEDDDEVIGAMGCHLTWMELNGIEKATMALHKKFLEERAIDFKIRPTLWLSVTNLLGFVYYSLQMGREAEKKFLEVVAVDENNMNAIANLAVIFREQFRMKHYKARIESLRRLVAQRDGLFLARSYADRAFAIRNFQEHRICFTYLSYIRKAVDSRKTMAPCPETAEWLYDYGLALHRRYTQTLNHRVVMRERDSQQGAREVADCFYQVTVTEGVCKELEALSWVCIGVLLCGHPGKTLADLVHCDIVPLSALDCFDRSLDLQPENAEICARVAIQFTELKMYGRARELLDKSIHKAESWLAFRHRGLLSIKMCEDSDLNTQISEHQMDGLLQGALSDFTRALEFKQTHADFSDLGYTCFLLQKPDRALECFKNAIESDEDDGFEVSLTHKRWAKCLSSIGEEEGAAMQLQEERKARGRLQQHAVVLEEAWRHRHGINCQGFECDITRFDYCSEDRPGYVNILGCENPVSSVRYVSGSRNAFKYDFFISFSHIDNKWSIELVKRLEKEFNLRGNIRYRDYQLGAAIAENIAESVANSFRTLIILSPDSLRDQWCRYEVQRAHVTSLQRRCVVPIMLRTCQIPREIEHLTFIKCERGQFKMEDWYRLGQSLCQDGQETATNRSEYW